MAGGNMGALDFSLGIRDNFSKPLEQLEKKLNEVSSYANKDLFSSIRGSYEKSAEDIKKSINKLQYAWDDVDAAVAKVTEKHPFADTSSFDKVRDKIKDIATEFMSIVQTTNKFDMGWSKKLTGFFKSADVDFQMHQITALSKAARNEVNASTKAEEEYWKREQKAIDRATASYANIGKEFMSLSKIKAGLLNQEFASPKDEAAIMAAVKSLDQYIEVMKKAKRQYADLVDQGRAQESILGKGGAALGQVFSSEYWTTKNGAVETMRMALTNWKALTQEQKEEKRQALAAIDAIVANNKTAANASKGIEQQEKRNEQTFVAEQKQIDRTIERYRELTQIVRSAMEQIINYRSRGLDYSSLLAKLQPVQAMRHDLRNAIGGEGYSFNLYDSGKARNQVKDLQDLTKQYDNTLKNLIANRDKVTNITSIIDAMQKRWADIKNNPGWDSVTLPSGIGKQIKDLENLRNALQALSQTDLGKANSVTDLLSRGHFGTLRRELNSAFKEIENGYRNADKASIESNRKTERNIETIKRSYARLFDQLNRLRNVRANANILGIDTKELDTAISHVISKLHSLRSYMFGTKDYNPNANLAYLSKSSLFTDADSKREEELVNRLIQKYLRLNAEKRKSNADVISQEARAAQQLASAFDRVHNSASKSSQVLSDIKSLFLQGGIVFGAQQFFNSVVRTGGEIEQQHIALQSILGDVSKANELFDQTKRLALESPFTFGELNRDVKQLAAFGVDTDRLYDTTKRLADVAAGLGVSFERLGLAYGQVKSRSWLDGKELRQFAYAGLPMLQKLADYYNDTRKDRTYSTRDVRDMITKREVSFEDVDAVIKRLTDEGGQFYNLQYVLSETLLGQFNKLKDAWDIMLGELASGNSLVGKFFKTGIQLATAFVQSIDKLGPVLAAAFSGFAVKKLMTAIGGTVGAGILSAKGSIAKDLRNRLLMGEQLNASEMRLLRTKGLITTKDMEILIKSGQITKQDLRRLYITGQINTALYKQSMAMTGLVTKSHGLSVYWRAFMMQLRGFNLTTFGSALFGGIKSGIGGLAKGLWGLIGGLPGALLTVGTMVVAKIYQSRQEMQDAIKRINEEQNARYRDIDDFLTKNPTDKAKGGTEKDRLAAIENYKEKLKEVAPYNEAAFEMTVNEKKSHEQRIDYLSQELKLVRDANDYNTRHSESLTQSAKGDFEDAADKAKDLETTYGVIEKRLGQLHLSDIQEALPRMLGRGGSGAQLARELQDAINKGETLEQVIARIKKEVFSKNGRRMYENTSGLEAFSSSIFGNGVIEGYNLPNGIDKYVADYYDQAKTFKEQVGKLKATIKAEIPNVGKDPTVTEAYKQFRESLEGQMQLSPEEKEMINISLDEAFGIDNNDLQLKLADKLRDTIDQTVPEIAAKIRSGKELTKADKDKINELMQVAVQELEVKYPMFSDKLQSLLDKSHFQATIHLAYAGDEWNDLQKRFYGNLPSILNDKRKYQLSNIANSWTKDNSMYAARNAAKSAIDQARNELKAEEDALKKGKSTQAIVDKKRQDLQDMKDAALYGLGYDYEGELKKSNKPPKTDHSAERAREKAEREEVKGYGDRISLYQKFYSEYKKLSDYMGDSGALDSLMKSGDFGSVFKYGLSDVKNYSKSIDELTKGLGRTTEERARLLNDANASKASKAREKMMEDLENSIKDANQELEEMERRYDVFKKIVKVNGDRNLANVIAFDRASGDTSAPTTIRENIKAMLMNRNPEWTDKDAEAFLNLDRSTVSSTYGMKSELGNYWEAGQKDAVNRLKEAKDLYVELIKDHQTIQEKIDAENRKYKEQLGLINTLNLPPEEKKKRTENLTYTHTETLGGLEFQKFKESSGWEAMFKDLDRVTADSIRGILSGLRGTLSTNNMSEETTKIIVEAMEKLQESLEKKSPLRSISEGYGLLAEISRVRAGGTNVNGNYVLSREQAARFGLPMSRTDEYTPQQLKDVETGVFKGFENSISGISGAFDGLQKVMQPVADLFAAMDANGLSEGVSIGSSAIGAMSNTMSGFNTMSEVAGGLGMDKLSGTLGKAGPYGAIAAAGISVVSSIVGMKTSSQKAYERQAAYLKSIQSTTSEINSSLKSRLSQSYGSSAQITGEKIRGNYQTEATEVRETYLSWSNAKKHNGGNRNRVKTNVDYDELNEFLRASGWNGELADGSTTDWIGAQSIQLLSGKWLEKYREAHAGSWANINSEAREYLERLIEIEGEEGELKSITDEISKSLADFDTETLKSEYKDLLNDLDSTNEDFADSFEKHMRNAILSTMLANLYSGRITELSNMTADAFDTTKGEYLSKSGVVKRHTGGDDSSDVLSEYTSSEMDGLKKFQDDLFSDIRSDRDKLADYFGWSDKNSSSMSSSIQGISETTGDLLAAYLNAIRADVSVIRQLNGVYWPKLDVTTQAQLQQLNMITDNTMRNAEAAERIEMAVNNMNDMFSKSFMGVNQLSVRVQ